ncbi:MAG: flagellar basal body L-ring protein FlgH [Thermodesulfobacteriota bacterium]
MNHRMKVLLIIALIMAAAVFLFAGCDGSSATLSPPSANVEAALRTPPVQLYESVPPKTEGSLFSDAVNPDLFSDVKARQVGDIITINIVESSKASKNAQTQLGRSNEVQAGISALVGFETYTHPFLTELDPNFNLGTGINATYESKFKGTGKTSRDDNVTAQISARVLQVLPNGQLVIRGSREIKVNNETQILVIQGVIRPEDVAADNTILSTYIADAKIDYVGKGDLARQQRQGWLSRLLDIIWPF